MRVRILHFASFREAAGREEEQRHVAAGTRAADLWKALAAENDYFGRYTVTPPVAVNREYVCADTVLREDDEVAFLPPVAGG